MKYFSIIILSCLGLLITSQSCAQEQYVTADDLESWVSYLSSDEMKGRQNGSDEMKQAAMWIAEKYQEFGIKPLKGSDTYLQEYKLAARSMTLDERNVIGYIEGSHPELKKEYIIITAHFDHIGIRRAVEGDSIYNGADDNAAGTSTLLGVAKAIKDGKMKTGRSIIFAAVSGEEMGIHGSRYIAKNPPVPLADIYANVNFEMTGHSEELGKGNFYMTGCSFSNLDDLIKEFGADKNINLIDTIAMADRLFFMSDNIAFARAKVEDGITYGVPGGTFATSTFAPHVHTPFDEVSQFDLENMADLVNYFSEMVVWLSKSEEEVKWTDESYRRIK